MRIEQQPGFVLHSRPWRETSLLVEVLSRDHGRLGLLARGVQGPRRHLLKAALQPLQAITFSAVQRGELAQLRQAEAIDVAPRLSGDAMLAGFYVNELILRLVPRHDPAPALFRCYADIRAALAAGSGSLAWRLRRFERDLLDLLGFGLDLQHDAEGQPIDPGGRYRLDATAGPRRLADAPGREAGQGVSGRALLALACDRIPLAGDMAGLRRALRAVLSEHLGERGLKSWEMVETLGRRR